MSGAMLGTGCPYSLPGTYPWAWAAGPWVRRRSPRAGTGQTDRDWPGRPGEKVVLEVGAGHKTLVSWPEVVEKYLDKGNPLEYLINYEG